ncbi:hypothetical protein M0804_001678 [Polistes exclamans]|nr:hypothetical protein M0804_001678 [Polistes exclamans]
MRVPGTFLRTASNMVEYVTVLMIFFFIFNLISNDYLLLIILFDVILTELTNSQNLWCYDCNTDLRNGPQNECNDPYVPGPSMDLIACPQNESYHCLKGVVLYKNVLVTIRACVPSRKIDHYCDHEKHFPHSTNECYFCNNYACNGHPSMKPDSIYTLGIILLILLNLSKRC